MKKAFSPLLLAVLLGVLSPGGGSLYAQSGAPALPTQALSALRQGNFEGMQSALTAEITRKTEGMSLEQIYADTSLMGLMTLSDLIAQTGADKMSELYARDKKYARFLNTFLKDAEWMHLYLSAGLVPADSEVGLRVLGDIWTECASEADFRKYLSLSTGIAAAWGAGNYANQLQDAERIRGGKRCDPVWRYKFFKKSHQDGKLASNFMSLKPWEIRFVAGGVWSDSSLKFLQEEINLPPNAYGDACWRAEYSGTSEFGESIQGPLYYSAWGEGAGQAENTVLHGGVCGALSHVGATAAAARGIPSYPVGQPGHCAYGFRPKRGDWQGGFGGPDGGPHNYIFPGDAPTNMRLMEAAFASDEKVDKAYRHASAARGLVRAGKKDEAKQAWGDALKTMPFNYYFHKDFQKFMRENNLYTPQQWYDYGVNVLGFMKTQGFAALDIVKDIQDQFLNAGDEDDQGRLKWFAQVNEALAYTPSSWKLDITPVLEDQSKMLRQLDSNAKLMASAIDIHLNHGDGTNFGKVMEWAIKNFASGKDDTFAKAFALAAARPAPAPSGQKSADGDVKPTEDKLREAYSKAIVAAEEMRSLSAARSIAEAASQYSRPEPGPASHEMNCPDGQLVSDKGYLRLSTTSSWDRPCDHLGVLTKEGGMFHTSEEEKPSVIVEIPEKVDLSGLLLVKNQGNEWRVNKVKVSRSVDGATWFDLAETDKMPDQWRIDTPDSPPARWIKVESLSPDGGKLVFHLRNILMFSKNK